MKWKLKVNIGKTKVVVFGCRHVKKEKVNVEYDGQRLEVVDSFKYLGVIFNYNGKFQVAKRQIVVQGNKALFMVLNRISKLTLPIDIQLELFDKLVLPVITYGCEVWGHEKCSVIEGVHLKFCKYILGVKKLPQMLWCMVSWDGTL